MAVHIVRGLYGLACAGGVYLGIRDGVLAPSLSNSQQIIKKNPKGEEGWHEYTNLKARELGISREVTVIIGSRFSHYGNNLFSLRMGIIATFKENWPEELIEQMIIHELVHIKNNDILTWTFVPLIMAIFTTLLLNAKFPIFSSLAGAAVGFIAHVALHRWREKQALLTAMHLTSSDDIEVVLLWLLDKEEREGSNPTLKDQCKTYLLSLYGPSEKEIIDYYGEYITNDKDEKDFLFD